MDLIERTLRDRVVGNNPNLTSHKVKHIILHFPLRRYFVNRVQAPLLKTMIALANKYPKPTKDNTDDELAHALIDIFERFDKLNKVRPDLFQALDRVVVNKVDVDSVYRYLLQSLLELVFESILDGKWKARPLGKPASRYWRETPPYGGEHSIIYKLIKHRDEIKSILGSA